MVRVLVIAYYVIKNKKNCKFNKLNKFLEQTLKGNKSDSSAEQTSVNVPRLFDLVTPAEERFKPAFYHYMKDTLVANDINQARQVAYGGRRFTSSLEFGAGEGCDTSSSVAYLRNRLIMDIMSAS